jgi:hypothetical protein
MAKYSKAQLEEMTMRAKSLYCKDFDTDTIAELLKVSKITVEKWAREHDFEKAKKSQIIALSELRNSILESYSDMLDGKKPKITPDAAVKYARAFELFSSKKQVLLYMFEGFELLTDNYQLQIQNERSKAKKTELLAMLKHLRETMNTVINNLNNEVLGND